MSRNLSITARSLPIQALPLTAAPHRTPALRPGYNSPRWPRTAATPLAPLPQLRRDASPRSPAPARSQRAKPGYCQAAVGLQRQQLIGRLDSLQRAGGTLALTDQGRERRLIGLNVGHDPALDFHRVFEGIDTCLPTRPCIREK